MAHGLPELLRRADARAQGATVFGYYVRDPERYGVVEMDETGKVVKQISAQPKDAPAITGADLGLRLPTVE